ncbi:MAG: peptidoglycan DD-metalloendopeptidase family protein [Candidatus Harrisonbacteria bacterium]|nr:peptidoglycan DD-metalloendopeptidase family protein [Candidatus Harrisonbacteria bacterium]
MKTTSNLLDLLFQNRSRFRDVIPKSLFKKPHREVNLPEEVLKFFKRHSRLKISPKEITNPDKCAQLVKQIHKELGLVWSCGGWLENREKLLAETYLKETKSWIHLGIDINVPVGTPVLATANGVVHLVDSDFPEKGGWGNFVIIEHQIAEVKFYSIYGHLASTALVNEDKTVLAGEAVGKVGTTKENGFWFPHTHFQLISETEMRRQEKPFTLDGYGSPKNLDYLRENYPNPLTVLPMGNKD